MTVHSYILNNNYTFVQETRVNNVLMDILSSLIQIRKEKKVSQDDLTGTLGINSTTLSRYESGRRKMPYDVLVKYAEYLGYEIRLIKK